jgi:excisionase family DNA binding protein
MGTPLEGAPIAHEAELLTVRQASLVLGVKVTTLRKWIHRGQLKVRRMGRNVRVRRKDVDAFVNTGKPLVKDYSQVAAGG